MYLCAFLFLRGETLEALDLLVNRQSTLRITSPAPNAEQIKIILDAGCRVPDHQHLRPWEFIVAKDEGLAKLSHIFKQAAICDGKDEKAIIKAENKPLRAPLIIIIVAKYIENKKVPQLEQQLSAGCAAMAMHQASIALGFVSVWRTGSYAYHQYIKDELQLADTDQIVGFLYIGSPVLKQSIRPHIDSNQFTRYL